MSTKKKIDFQSDALVLKLLHSEREASYGLIEYITALRSEYVSLKKAYRESLNSKKCSIFPLTCAVRGNVPTLPMVVHHIEGAVPEDDRIGMVTSEDQIVEKGQIGDIWDLTRVQNAADEEYGFDFYHHCPEMQDDLVRISYRGKIDNHICLICNQEFYDKGRPLNDQKED